MLIGRKLYNLKLWGCSDDYLDHNILLCSFFNHDDVIKWKHSQRYWPFVRGIHWSTVNSPHKGQWRGAFMFSLICAWINGWVNNHEAGDLRRHHAHYDVIVMIPLVRMNGTLSDSYVLYMYCSMHWIPLFNVIPLWNGHNLQSVCLNADTGLILGLCPVNERWC